MLRKQKGQSLVEFSMILPVFILLVLGMLQMSLLFINVMMLKYTAYMVARVGLVYEESERQEPMEKSETILKYMMKGTNYFNQDKVKMMTDALIGEGINAVQITVLDTVFDSTFVKMIDYEEDGDSKYMKVTIGYDMPLKVPVVNKVIGMFQRDWRHRAVSYGGFPLYSLKTSAIVRVKE
jgi:Flp pilus assembly protein TadG